MVFDARRPRRGGRPHERRAVDRQRGDADASAGPSCSAPVLGRVVGMLAARAQCPIDRLDDALLLTDAVAAHAPGHTANGRVTVHVHAETDGPRRCASARCAADGAQRPARRRASLPGVGNVFERVADEVDACTADGGRRAARSASPSAREPVSDPPPPPIPSH